MYCNMISMASLGKEPFGSVQLLVKPWLALTYLLRIGTSLMSEITEATEAHFFAQKLSSTHRI